MDKTLKPAISVGFGPLMISGVTFLISIIAMSLAELMTMETTLGISLAQLASSANFVSISALSAAIIVFSVAFANTPGIKRIVLWLILAFVLFFSIEIFVIYWYQQVGIHTGYGIFLQQVARLFNFFALATLIAAIGIPSMDYFTKRWEIKIKT